MAGIELYLLDELDASRVIVTSFYLSELRQPSVFFIDETMGMAMGTHGLSQCLQGSHRKKVDLLEEYESNQK
jgi:hypothetical protein